MEPASLLYPSGPNPVARQGQDGLRPEGMQKLPEVDEYASQPSAGLYSLTPRVASYWYTPLGFDDMTCLYTHTYYWMLAIKANRLKFIILSGSRQNEVH